MQDRSFLCIRKGIQRLVFVLDEVPPFCFQLYVLNKHQNHFEVLEDDKLIERRHELNIILLIASKID